MSLSFYLFVYLFIYLFIYLIYILKKKEMQITEKGDGKRVGCLDVSQRIKR